MTQGILDQLETASGRGIQSSGTFAEHHMAMIIAAAQFDSRVLGMLSASSMFNESVIESKSAAASPTQGGAAPKGP